MSRDDRAFLRLPLLPEKEDRGAGDEQKDYGEDVFFQRRKIAAPATSRRTMARTGR